MKLALVLILFYLCFTHVVPSIAQDKISPTSTPQRQVQGTNEFTVENEPSGIISVLKNFIEGFDSFLGGFIFYTPNPLSNTIKLKDNSEIPGVTKYRDMFNGIAIPVLAIIIAIIAVSKLGSDNVSQLKSFALRFLTVIVLFITVPPALSYSIQANNLLVQKISSTQQFTGFLQNYFDKSQEQIARNESSEKFGIPSFDISLKTGIFKSFGKFIVQIFLFGLTFLFLFGGLMYVGFQFVIRFATLLFLGVIYPIVLPFYLAERTQDIVHIFLKTWLTFLIQQPAFVLGFALATDIFSSILNAKGPSVGLLFFYTGFLFFLGGVNILVARIFGNTWDVMANNMRAAVATRAVGHPVQSQMQSLKRSLAPNILPGLFGKQMNNYGKPNKAHTEEYVTDLANRTNTSSGVRTDTKVENNRVPAAMPQFSQDLSKRGLNVLSENAKQGVVAVSGEAYQYTDPKTGLSSVYSSRHDAIADGVSENRIEPIHLDNNRFIDLSSFNHENPNPHNYSAMQAARRAGKDLDYAHIHEKSPTKKIQHFLELNKSRNETYGISGVIVKRQAKEGSGDIVRMYTNKSYEKHKDI